MRKKSSGKTLADLAATNTQKRLAILSVVEESGGMETVALMKATGFKKCTLVDWLHSMLETGHVARTKRTGQFGKHVWFWYRGENKGPLGALSRRYAPAPKKPAPVQDMKRIFSAAATVGGVCSYNDLPREFFGAGPAAHA